MATVLSQSVLDQNGPNDHFGQNGLISNWILAFARPKWTKMVHYFGLTRSILVHLGPPTVLWPNSRISGTGKGEPAANLGSTLPWTLSPTFCAGCCLKSTVTTFSIFSERRSHLYPYQEWPRQTKPKKGQFMNFSHGHSGTKVQCESCLFS